MAALQERDVSALLDVSAELAALTDVEPFPSHFLGRLAELVGCRDANYCELDRGRELTLFMAWWDDGDGSSGVPGPEEQEGEAFWRLRPRHPVAVYRERTNDWTSARKVSDFLTGRDFRRTEVWNELYRQGRLSDWMAAGLSPTGTHTRTFIFTRNRGEFDEQDRLLLELLLPQLQRRHDRVHAAAQAADALSSLEEDDTDDPGHVVLCSRDGVIEFASPHSRRLLTTYLECANGRVPEPVLGALWRRQQPLVVERGDHRLTLRAAPAAELVVLLLGEEDLRLDRLTPRQRTILEHVARGGTDAEIASKLGIAPATVNKHLEQMYERLGVHTRTAAAAIVSRPRGVA